MEGNIKARIKATGEIIEVATYSAVYELEGTGRRFNFDEVELVEDNSPVGPIDYWTRLEHQAAIAAMQGILSSPVLLGESLTNAKKFDLIGPKAVAIDAYHFAHALVEKMKKSKL